MNKPGQCLVYVLINSPVAGSRPYVQRIFKANPWLTTMAERDDGYVSKRNLERLGVNPPVGARFHMLPYTMPMDFCTRLDEPSGPDFTDRLTEAYLREARK